MSRRKRTERLRTETGSLPLTKSVDIMDADRSLLNPQRRVTVMESTPPKRQTKEAPDTGYAWVVAVAACLINLVVAGLGRMSGILYVAFIDSFHVTRKEATEPFSIRSSTRNLLGPIVGILGQQYGVRSVTVAGGIIATASSALCYFAPSMMWITVFWGAFNGIGTALTMTLPLVVIGQYFKKYRTTASGMAFSGGCVGAFIFPVLLEHLLNDYGVQGTFLIMAGIIMNVIPAALVLRRPSWLKNIPTETIVFAFDDAPESLANVAFASEIYPQSVSIGNVSNSTTAACEASANSVPSKLKSSDDIKSDHDTVDVSNGHAQVEEPANGNAPQEVTVQLEMPKPQMTDVGGGFIKHIKTFLKLNSNPLFLLISLCRAVHFITFVPVVTVIVDFGIDKGLLEEYGKYSIAALSLGDLIGRLCLGWVTDRGYTSLPKYMLVVMMIQGATTASLPLLHGMPAILTMVAVFGMLQGSLFVRHPVLVSRYMGENEQSIAMGSMNFLSGLLGFALPSFIGYFRDTLGSYDIMFYITGGTGSAVGILWVFEPYLVRFSRKENYST